MLETAIGEEYVKRVELRYTFGSLFCPFVGFRF